MLIALDFSSDVPIYAQIRNQIVLGIAGGSLQPGQKLPAIRALANESGINMMTVNKAYQQLRQEGYIQIDRRSGAAVSEIPRGVLPGRTREALRLILAEAKAHGVRAEEFLAECRRIYDESEVLP